MPMGMRRMGALDRIAHGYDSDARTRDPRTFAVVVEGREGEGEGEHKMTGESEHKMAGGRVTHLRL